MTDSATPSPSPNNNSGTSKTKKIETSRPTNTVDLIATPFAQVTKAGGGALSVFAILVSLIALGGSAYTWYQNQVVQVKQESQLSVGVIEIGGQVSRLGDSVARLQSNQSDVISQAQLNSAALQLERKLLNQLGILADQQTKLGEAVSKINRDQQKGVNQYVVDESAQLLRLANNSVLFSADVNSAINALSLADAQLKSVTDPRYSTVRTQILKEVNALRNVQLPDLEALSSRLQGLVQLVPSLPLENEPEAQATGVKPVLEEQAITWKTELRKVWQDTLNSVQIQRVDQPPKPLLAPEQRYFLDQNLILTIEKAELAMIQGRPVLFKMTIENATAWLTEYFDLSDSRVQSVIQELGVLAAQPFDSAMPDISGSYQLLQSIKGGQ
ncbi:MAG: uroporphyrin-3 C-methyltransferase [Arenicella sp.]|jgi:uroporphyrin-3 C-methyltransferase